MGGEVIRLPRRFPVGTRYVIEGSGGLIRLRYLEFPDGRKVDLPTDLAARMKPPQRRRPARKQPQPGAKKIMCRDGTPSGLGN